MSALWTAEEVAAATGGRATRDFATTGLSIDSRTLAPGDLFVALKGDRHDGHDHVAAAFAAGAAAALVAHVPDGLGPDAPCVLVPDTQGALEDLARASRARSLARVAAITGSVGKTSTKEALAAALAAQAPTHASLGNLNNHIGVPLSLARMPRATRFAVFELGMNHPGEISPLSRMVRPDCTVITWVAAAHLEFFEDESGIADEKATIMDGLPAGGVAILPRDNRHFERLFAHASRRGVGRVVTFGASAQAEIRLIGYEGDGQGGFARVAIDGLETALRIGTPGRHIAMNCLGVLAAVAALGGDVARAGASFAKLAPPKGRGVAEALDLPQGRITLIDDSYNASPAAVEAALATLASRPLSAGGRRILALGDMLELGPTAPQIHAGLAQPALDAGIDLVCTAGPIAASLHEAMPKERRGPHAANSAELVAPLLALLRAGDVLLVKGSLGSRMGAVVAALRAAHHPVERAG